MTPLACRRLWLSIGWCLILLVVYVSLSPQPALPPVDYDDKLGHVAAYGTLMAWFAQLYVRRAPTALALLAMGCVLEVLQGLSGYREMALADMLANAVGVASGWLLSLLFPDLLGRAEKLLG